MLSNWLIQDVKPVVRLLWFEKAGTFSSIYQRYSQVRLIAKVVYQLGIKIIFMTSVLEKWYDNVSSVWTHNARVIAKSWIKGSGEDKGLQPR
jgi:hypothetical protein